MAAHPRAVRRRGDGMDWLTRFFASSATILDEERREKATSEILTQVQDFKHELQRDIDHFKHELQRDIDRKHRELRFPQPPAQARDATSEAERAAQDAVRDAARDAIAAARAFLAEVQAAGQDTRDGFPVEHTLRRDNDG